MSTHLEILSKIILIVYLIGALVVIYAVFSLGISIFKDFLKKKEKKRYI